MRLRFRDKMLGMAGLAALALGLVIAASRLIANRVDQQIETIRGRYVPKLDLEPRLKGQLDRLARDFQDAADARDTSFLDAAAQQKQAFLRDLQAAGGAVDPAAAAELRAALDAYYAAALDVTRRLMARETGQELIDSVTSMQQKLGKVEALLSTVAGLDRRALSAAFDAASRASAQGDAYRVWLSLACLAVVLVVSLQVSRGLLRSLGALTEGFRRFGEGDFRPMPETGEDELAEVARGANQMAENLARRTAQLEVANRELEAFSYSVAHDLRAPLRGVSGFAEVLLADYDDRLDDDGRDCLREILGSAKEMGELIDALLSLSRVTRAALHTEPVDLAPLTRAVVEELATAQPHDGYELVVGSDLRTEADPRLARAVLENLLGNAWKFTAKVSRPRIEVGADPVGSGRTFFVKDNGAGFDPAYAAKLFAPFQRLHTAAEFPGTGIGLATVQRIVHRHGGRIWAEGAVGKGATFFFTFDRISERSTA
ncbi:MAG TPA: ATP-binding protein [Myxococcales bacterium]|nr:ATP-binding protein [Myxococcales bacterium]